MDDGPMHCKRLVTCGDTTGFDATSFGMSRWSTQADCPSWETFEVGEHIARIIYHAPGGDGDAHYCDAYFHDGSMTRFFRPLFVNFAPPPAPAAADER